MFFKQPDLTSGSRPTLLPDETLLFVQDGVGLYEGKYKIASCQKGHAYLTSHRACYIDDTDPRTCSVAIDLRDVERHEYQASFLRSSAKISFHPKPLRRGYGSTRQPSGQVQTRVQKLAATPSSPGSRSASPFRAPIAPAVSPVIITGTWVCPICTQSNPVPSNFDPVLVSEAFPIPPCLTCGIKPPYSLVLKAAIAANVSRGRDASANTSTSFSQTQSPQKSNGPSLDHTAAPRDYVICSRCTFHNYPSLQNCEICGAPLATSSLNVGRQAAVDGRRPESPAPEMASLNLEPDDENSSVMFSFRNGGDKVFYERLKNAMIQRKWLLQNAPPVPRPSQISTQTTFEQNSAPSTPTKATPTAVGIAGLEQRGLQSRKNNENVLGSAFEDLEALMASAKEVVALAEKFAAASGNDLVAGDDSLYTQSANAMGMVATRDVVAADGTNNLYISTLARILAEYVTDAKRGILKRQGGVMSLVDLWATFNKSRNGVELISPHDCHAAAETWEKLHLPVKLRRFRSGLLVVQSRDWNDEKTIEQLKKWLEILHASRAETAVAWDRDVFGCGVTAQEAATRFGWSLGVATEELEMAEERGILCREEAVEGLRFWKNYLADEDGA